MAYTPQTWTDGVSKLNATRLGYIETGIEDAAAAADTAQTAADTAQAAADAAQAAADAAQATADAAGTNIVNADVDANAAIALSKLELNPAPTPATSLPGSPVDGQIAVLTDSTTAPTYTWRFRYLAAGGTYKWQFVGGAPLVAEVATAQATGSLGSYVALATAGPSITVPRAGVWIVTHGFQGLGAASATAAWMSFDIGASSAVDTNGTASQQGSAIPMAAMRQQQLTIVAASTALVSKYKSTGANSTFGPRHLSILPVQVA